MRDFGAEVGDPVLISGLEAVEIEPGKWSGVVLRIDRYGNVITSLPEILAKSLNSRIFSLHINGCSVTQYYSTYAASSASPRGTLFLMTGSSGLLEVALNQGNAALALGAVEGAEVFFTSTWAGD